MASIIKVDTIQDQDGNNIISEAANTITIGASGDTITIPSGATLANSGIVTGFQSTGIDDNATSTAITIDSSQRVGIGTASPAVKFQVGQTGDSGHLVNIGVDNSNTELRIANRAFYGYYSDGAVIQGSTGKHISFHTDSTTFGANERMRIDSSGNVGIGTSSPESTLHVVGTSDLQSPIKVAASSVTGATLISDRYAANESLINIGHAHSGGALVLGSLVKPSDSSESDATGYLSSYDGSSVKRSAIKIDGVNGQIKFLTTNTSANVAVDTAVAMTERVRIHSNGVTAFNDGIALGVGVNNTSSNVLDDYEEGTFTTTLTPSTSGTITIASNQDTLKYIKIGNTVFIQGRLTISTISAPVGVSVILGNMPFTPTSAVETSGWFGGMCAISFNGSSTFEPYTVWTTDGVVKITTTTSSINSNTRIHFNFFYETA